MVWPVAVADFKAYFVREFPYGGATDTVMDPDITRALSEAALAFNEGLWNDDAERQTAYLYLTAHFLVLNIRTAGGLAATAPKKGIQSNEGGVIQSKGVGSVSVSYAVPQSITENPIFSQYLKTDFGQKYLTLLAPRLVGNMVVLGGSPVNYAP